MSPVGKNTASKSYVACTLESLKLFLLSIKGRGRKNVSVFCPMRISCCQAESSRAAIVSLLNDSFIKSLNHCVWQRSRFVESMAFTVSCRNCKKHFRTGYSTKKHHEMSHPELQFNGGLFRNCEGHPLVNEPVPKQLEGEELDSYKTWLAILAEQISGSLNPNAKGKNLKDHGIQAIALCSSHSNKPANAACGITLFRKRFMMNWNRYACTKTRNTDG